MQMDGLLSNAKAFKKVVEVADDTIGALAAVDTLIDKVIHLLWKPFTAKTPKIAHFRAVMKYIGPG